MRAENLDFGLWSGGITILLLGPDSVKELLRLVAAATASLWWHLVCSWILGDVPRKT